MDDTQLSLNKSHLLNNTALAFPPLSFPVGVATSTPHKVAALPLRASLPSARSGDVSTTAEIVAAEYRHASLESLLNRPAQSSDSLRDQNRWKRASQSFIEEQERLRVENELNAQLLGETMMSVSSQRHEKQARGEVRSPPGSGADQAGQGEGSLRVGLEEIERFLDEDLRD